MANPTSPPPAVLPKKSAIFCHWLFALLLAIAAFWEMVSFFRPLRFQDMLDTVFISLAATGTLAALWRQLPLQNILLAALGIALIGGGVSALGARTALPFGPFFYGTAMGPQLFKTLPWAMPLVWLVVILNSRGVARLMLRPWRKNKNYGFRMIALTGVLVLLFDVTLEPFATLVKFYWRWVPTAVPVTWEGAALVNFLSWGFLAILILLFITPVMISKKPRTKSSPDYHPLCVWLGGIILFATGCGVHGLWLPVIVDAVIGIVAAIFAVRGAMW
jgi:putative membrane protein